jgi:hypothetical protein
MWYYGFKQAKNDKYEQLINESIPFYMKKLDEQVAANDGTLALKGKITWGDVYSIAVFEYINCLMGYDTMAEYKNLKKVYEKVMSANGVQKYLKTRPADRIPAFSL